jgi:hypothetical protein
VAWIINERGFSEGGKEMDVVMKEKKKLSTKEKGERRERRGRWKEERKEHR